MRWRVVFLRDWWRVRMGARVWRLMAECCE